MYHCEPNLAARPVNDIFAEERSLSSKGIRIKN